MDWEQRCGSVTKLDWFRQTPNQLQRFGRTRCSCLLLLVLLIKSKLLRIKMSLLGSVLGFAMLVGFLISTGLLTLVAGGAVAYAATQSKGGN
jgi:hypothetical protein